ncbi:aspartate ammonia-lyase [Bordetella genomosp. 8]|uniref:Aspartate ammonia-lyase n=1 Tax=Bordetella genomosp. 8 TaxID=1416806 RepID=A0A1W6YPE7_9BORD|nr:aspartate ammonia-lyase [Bordetella genomosp. 8]ARP82888.1 aspartate ammonia-lyase [Bordetella genomosp. 8]
MNQAHPAMRTEHDALGSMQLADSVDYGIQTARAVENFSISGITIADIPGFVASIATIKKAAAQANERVGALDAQRSAAIQWAADEVLREPDPASFPVDIYHGGGGTAANMNVNEVLARLASRRMAAGDERASVHPNDHVNLGQSTNDVIPSAMKITVHGLLEALATRVSDLCNTLRDKESEFADVVKLGRTCLQDALPVTLGQQFSGYRSALERQLAEIQRVRDLCLELPLGGTAVGTGFGAAPGYTEAVYASLRTLTGRHFHREANLFDGLQNADVWIAISAALKGTSTVLNKLSADLRLMSSGPRAGLGEIELPAVQPGSSIMPGKINPVIPEMVMQVHFRVLGNDATVTRACEGELDLNVWESVIIHCVSDSISLLSRCVPLLADRCVAGIRANHQECLRHAGGSLALSTVLAALFGYERASQVAKQAAAQDKTIQEVSIELGLLTPEAATRYLDPMLLTAPERFDVLFSRENVQAINGTFTWRKV